MTRTKVSYWHIASPAAVFFGTASQRPAWHGAVDAILDGIAAVSWAVVRSSPILAGIVAYLILR